jgi:hypothetical protein
MGENQYSFKILLEISVVGNNFALSGMPMKTEWVGDMARKYEYTLREFE